jgi:hypothetical protein
VSGPTNDTAAPLEDQAACRARGHGRVVCLECGAELVDVATVRSAPEVQAHAPASGESPVEADTKGTGGASCL